MPKKLKKLRLDDEHYIEFGFNNDGDFILKENYSNTKYLKPSSDILELSWFVEILIKKRDWENQQLKKIKFFKNLNELAKKHYQYHKSGFITQTQIELNPDNDSTFSCYYEKCLQEDNIDYVKTFMST